MADHESASKSILRRRQVEQKTGLSRSTIYKRMSEGTFPPAPAGSNTKALGQLIYVDYVYAFEIAAVILLVAIVAAIALTHRERKASKYQDPGQQVKVRREDRVRIVQMPVEKSDS